MENKESSKSDLSEMLSAIQPENETPIDEIDSEQIELEVLPTFQKFKDNNYGRPTKYTEDMPERLWNYYFKPRIAKKTRKKTYHGKTIDSIYYEAEKPLTVEGFLVEQCIGESTFYDWLKLFPEFSETYAMCKKRFKDVLVSNILEGEWGIKSGTFISINYTDMREQIRDDGLNNGAGGVEYVPPKKGYDVSDIEKYCKKPFIETTAIKVPSGE